MVVAAKVKDTMALLIIGLMFGSITAAIVSVLILFYRMLKNYSNSSIGPLEA